MKYAEFTTEQEYECLSCGHIETQSSNPLKCPACGADGMQGRGQSLE